MQEFFLSFVKDSNRIASFISMLIQRKTKILLRLSEINTIYAPAYCLWLEFETRMLKKPNK